MFSAKTSRDVRMARSSSCMEKATGGKKYRNKEGVVCHDFLMYNPDQHSPASRQLDTYFIISTSGNT